MAASRDRPVCTRARLARGRRGVTLVELLCVLVVVATLVALAVPRIGAYGDRLAVRQAGGEVVALFATARELALARRAQVAVRVDSASGVVRVEAEGNAVTSRAIRDLYGVELAATRDSMAYDARGLGHGAANLRVVLRRGGARDTVFVARLGRVRRSAG